MAAHNAFAKEDSFESRVKKTNSVRVPSSAFSRRHFNTLLTSEGVLLPADTSAKRSLTSGGS
jgi:hypothetical protein